MSAGPMPAQSQSSTAVRLNDVEPPVGDRYADMTPINR